MYSGRFNVIDKYIADTEIEAVLYTGNKSFAFLVLEPQADLLLGLPQMTVNGVNQFHKMKERLRKWKLIFFCYNKKGN